MYNIKSQKDSYCNYIICINYFIYYVFIINEWYKNLNIEHEIVENSNGVMRILIQDSLSEDEKRNLIDYYIKDYLKNSSENEKIYI